MRGGMALCILAFQVDIPVVDEALTVVTITAADLNAATTSTAGDGVVENNEA